jgi:hypothetical protein
MITRKKVAMVFAGAAVLFGVGGAIAAAQPVQAPPPQAPAVVDEPNGPDTPGVPDLPEPGDTPDAVAPN